MSFKSGAQARLIYTVAPYQGGWAVEHDGAYTDASTSKEEVKAAANKRARASQDAGHPCQVRVSGEGGFFVDTKAVARAIAARADAAQEDAAAS
jgi:hypothetical protein